MDKQGILDLLLSSQPENIALAEQLLIGAGVSLKSLLDEFGYSQIGITGFEFFEKENLTIKGLSTETIPKLPASIKALDLIDTETKAFVLKNECNLERLYCDNNQLSKLNVQGCGNLEHLYCNNNQLSELNVQGCVALKYLYCHKNQLSELNAQGCGNLKRLYCDEKTKILNAPNSCEIHFYN